MSKFKNTLLAAVGLLLLSNVLLLTQRTTVRAQSPGGSLASLISTVNALKMQVAALQAKTAPVSVSGTDLTVTGINVHIVDGTGSTISTSGLGNLIVGYNSTGHTDNAGNAVPDVHTGSHNLIVGDHNNYGSYGGIVAGDNNIISSPYASVSGGENNTASGNYAAVSGGRGNTASVLYASVSGGIFNTASGPFASISGGANNAASGSYSSVGGGELNSAIINGATVSGGYNAQTDTSDGWSAGINQAGIPGFAGNFVSP